MPDKPLTDDPDIQMQDNPEADDLLNMGTGDSVEYADPTNKKWPIDTESHIHAALSYFNNAKDSDGNTPEHWSSIGHKIATKATSHYGVKHTFENGKIVKETASTDSFANTCDKCQASGNTGSYCPKCGNSLKITAKVDDAAIVPDNKASQADVNGDCNCPNFVGINRIEKFCTVCGKPVNSDASATVSVAVPSNESPGNSINDLGALDAVLDNEFDADVTETYIADPSEYTIFTDKLDDGVLMRVRQLAMVTDALNKNNRVYPRQVVIDALDETNNRAKMGLVHSDYSHPKIVKGASGEDAFVDEYDKKTSRIAKAEYPDKQGRVFITRSILDTPRGREVARDFTAGKPKGLSSRILMKCHKAVIDGLNVLVADKMKIPTWDDMATWDKPAVPDTQKYYTLLTDSVLEELGLPGSPDNIAANAAIDSTPKEKIQKMNPEFKAALDTYTLLSLDKSDSEAVADARKDVVKAIRKLSTKDPEFDVLAARKALVEADKAFTDEDGLYGGGRVQPSIVDAKNIEAPMGAAGQYAKDILVSSTPTEADQKPDEMVPVTSEAATAVDADLVEMLAERKAIKAKAEAEKAVADHLDAIADAKFADTPAEVRADIISTVKRHATTVAVADSLVDAMLDTYSKSAAAGKKSAIGMTTEVTDPYGSTKTVITRSEDRKPAFWAEVDSITAAVDAVRAKSMNGDKIDLKIRAYNKPIIEGWVKNMEKLRKASSTEGEFVSALDSLDQYSAAPFSGETVGATDATVLSNFYNQPTISTALLVQSYQDLTALQYVDPIGPSTGQGDTNWAQIPTASGIPGWVLRIPSETYNGASGAGTVAVRPNFGSYYAGNLVGDNLGIPEATTQVVWESFATLPRTLGFSVTKGASRSAGLGPLNLDLVARHMYHLTYDKNRTLDNAMYGDMLYTSDIYGSVTNTSESVNLTYNSVYNAAGSVTVNLNPRKAASTAPVAATSTTSADPFVTYGANVLSAVRLAGQAVPGASGATIYAGTSAGTTPLVKPKITPDLSGTGVYQFTTNHPITVSAPASAVEGYIDGTGQIQNLPTTWLLASPGTATYAVDHEIGVIVFVASGTGSVSGSGVLVTTAVTVTYDYVTNCDNIQILTGGNLGSFGLLTNADFQQLGFTSLTPEQYYNRVLQQIDQSAGKMASTPIFMSPNLFITGVQSSEAVIAASTFYKLNSPEGSVLFPMDQPSAFANRNGVQLCRHNSPWQVGDHRGLLTRKGATKYGVGEPSQFNGPYPKYDASSNLIALDAYYLQEWSTIATPTVQNTSGVILNPPSRTIIYRSPLG